MKLNKRSSEIVKKSGNVPLLDRKAVAIEHFIDGGRVCLTKAGNFFSTNFNCD